MAYPTSAQIRAGLEALRNANPFCSIINLQQSLGGVDITALKISKVTEGKRAKVLFTGGVHANELAPPSAVLSCVTVLLDAYKAAKGITYGAFSLTANDVKDIVEHVDIYAAPMINPDGYALTLSLIAPGNTELAGRKNGRNTGPCVLPDRPGVNINRNFDIVWDFQRLYLAGNNVASSSNGCHYNYTGVTPGPLIGNPFSEPETENVKALLDEGIEFYVDVHMYGPTILHSWGIETNQTTDPTMWFGEPSWDGKRDGTVPIPPFLEYKEFIPAAELSEVVQLANHMAKAIKDGTKVPGRAAIPYQDYLVQPGALLYPTSGSADDYAYSRHRKDPLKPFVRAYTMECGDGAHSGHRPTAAQYKFIEQEVHCALLSLLQSVATWIGKQNPAQPPPTSGSGGGCFSAFFFGALGLAGAAAVVAEVMRG
jgi:carboxypeptidase T